MFLSEWRGFPWAPCLAGKENLTTCVSMLLKSRASLTCFRACFLSGRAKDLSAPPLSGWGFEKHSKTPTVSAFRTVHCGRCRLNFRISSCIVCSIRDSKLKERTATSADTLGSQTIEGAREVSRFFRASFF